MRTLTAPRRRHASDRATSPGERSTLVLSFHRPAGLRLDAPRADFAELASSLGASVSFPPAPAGRLARIERKTGFGFNQALRARGAGAEAFLSLSEGLGLPLATIDRARTPHVMVAHNMVRPRMRLYSQLTRSLGLLDRVVVLSRAHGDYIRDEVGLAPERIRFVQPAIDDRFWRPRGGAVDGTVVSVGGERRDYGTLVEAVRPLAAATVIVAGSQWSTTVGTDRSSHGDRVSFRSGLSFAELRDLYASAAVVVVPLIGGERYAAGVTGMLEAMAMGKALVMTRTPALAEFIVDGETVRLVPAGDPSALRGVLAELLADEPQRRRLGQNARALIEAEHCLDGYVTAVTRLVAEARAEHSA
jgi:glycosyltransferase involved in cell wall biosynthesis